VHLGLLHSSVRSRVHYRSRILTYWLASGMKFKAFYAIVSAAMLFVTKYDGEMVRRNGFRVPILLTPQLTIIGCRRPKSLRDGVKGNIRFQPRLMTRNLLFLFVVEMRY